MMACLSFSQIDSLDCHSPRFRDTDQALLPACLGVCIAQPQGIVLDEPRIYNLLKMP